MPTPEGKTLVRVSETRVGEHGLEGLCHYDDGTSEWRAPDKVSAEVEKRSADGETVERQTLDPANINIAGATT